LIELGDTACGEDLMSMQKKKSLVAGPKATKPKKKGGLGIIDLRCQNDALLLKHLDKFYNRKNIP
jgi:hypothetical protein